jgi:hypothetical protein
MEVYQMKEVGYHRIVHVILVIMGQQVKIHVYHVQLDHIALMVQQLLHVHQIIIVPEDRHHQSHVVLALHHQLVQHHY